MINGKLCHFQPVSETIYLLQANFNVDSAIADGRIINI